MTYTIRKACVEDAPRILAVYAPYVAGTTVSFETSVPAAEEFSRRVEATLERYCYLVACDEVGGEVVGYAYNSAVRSRPAYQWASETSIYLAPKVQGKGLGSRLLQALEQLMAAQGIVVAIACITSENTGSVTFHEHHGYRVCGHFEDCAYKLGRWLSVTWMDKRLGELADEPCPQHAPTDAEYERVLRRVNPVSER